MSKVLSTVNGVEITERVARIYAKRFGVSYEESQLPGVLGSLTAWIEGPEAKDADAFLLESPETRDDFKAVREAFEVRVSGAVKAADQFSNVSIVEVIPDWADFVKTLDEVPAEEAKTAEGEAAADQKSTGEEAKAE